jgi:hypothetical protein
MKIRKISLLTDGVYRVTLYTEDWSQADQELMAKFGEPEIDVGGSFTGPPAYTLDTNLVRIMSESPFTQGFDSSDYADAQDRAEVWKDEVSTRISTAVATLRGNADNFSGEEVENV